MPWRVTDEERDASVCVRDAHGDSVASVKASRGSYRPTPDSWRQAQASAMLIAAAPDLWEALSEIIEDVPRGIRPDRLEKARAALRKAEGL
jgi:hypothetical protein